MSTPVCELLGIERPIVQAPMSDITGLAAAVSNAGALGMVTLTWSADTGAVVRETAALTARPFGGNFVLTSDHHRDLDQALEAGLKIVSFMWGGPAGYVERVHDAGGIVLHTVGSAEEADRQSRPARTSSSRRAGRPAGTSGARSPHCRWCPLSRTRWRRYRSSRLAGSATPAESPRCSPWAPGPRGWAPRFLLAEEMPIHEDYRRRLIAAAETDPQWYPNLYDVGWPDSPHRALRNSTARAWDATGRPPDSQRPGAGDVIAHFASGEAIVRYEPAPPMAGTTGDIEALSMWAGQSVALAREPQSAADIVTELTSRL
jgi:nitronate monooxygenase